MKPSPRSNITITPRDAAAQKAAAVTALHMLQAARPLEPPSRSLAAGHPRPYSNLAVSIDRANGAYGKLMQFGSTK